MKIVYNDCYGGFGVSKKGMIRYAEIKGMEITFLDNPDGGIAGPGRIELTSADGRVTPLYHSEIRRSDPVLVQVVEELGTVANGPFAKLEITELPAGARYRIDEYDGTEQVMTIDDYRWEVAS